MAGQEGIEPQPAVLETAALPIELLAYDLFTIIALHLNPGFRLLPGAGSIFSVKTIKPDHLFG